MVSIPVTDLLHGERFWLVNYREPSAHVSVSYVDFPCIENPLDDGNYLFHRYGKCEQLVLTSKDFVWVERSGFDPSPDFDEPQNFVGSF